MIFFLNKTGQALENAAGVLRDAKQFKEAAAKFVEASQVFALIFFFMFWSLCIIDLIFASAGRLRPSLSRRPMFWLDTYSRVYTHTYRERERQTNARAHTHTRSLTDSRTHSLSHTHSLCTAQMNIMVEICSCNFFYCMQFPPPVESLHCADAHVERKR